MSKPWNCPKGYGLCWECILPCDTPSSSNSESNLGKLLHRAIDEGFVDRHKEKVQPTPICDAAMFVYNDYGEQAVPMNVARGLERELAEKSAALAVAVAHAEDSAALLSATATREIANIANARRFDREAFRDDTEFADWAQSRCRHALAAADKSAADKEQG